jgi:hypothetical protein
MYDLQKKLWAKLIIRYIISDDAPGTWLKCSYYAICNLAIPRVYPGTEYPRYSYTPVKAFSG